jgi:hypothetical protein
MKSPRHRHSEVSETQMPDHLEVRPLAFEDKAERARFKKEMSRHHYLKSDALVAEQLRCVAEVDGRWVALLSC